MLHEVVIDHGAIGLPPIFEEIHGHHPGSVGHDFSTKHEASHAENHPAKASAQRLRFD
jgi:hypothetical protein